MNNVKSLSLAELETHYRKQLEHWSSHRAELLKQAQACEQEMAVYDQKLRHIQALVGGSEVAIAMPSKIAQARKSGKAKRRRKSPVREATLEVLRNRPGQRLTVAQIRTAIRKDKHRRVSRQAINVNADILEDAGLIQRARAPKGSGARFVFWAV